MSCITRQLQGYWTNMVWTALWELTLNRVEHYIYLTCQLGNITSLQLTKDSNEIVFNVFKSCCKFFLLITGYLSWTDLIAHFKILTSTSEKKKNQKQTRCRQLNSFPKTKTTVQCKSRIKFSPWFCSSASRFWLSALCAFMIENDESNSAKTKQIEI